jgi:hypothetical protein
MTQSEGIPKCGISYHSVIMVPMYTMCAQEIYSAMYD